MKDKRVQLYRSALEGLMESLSAIIRIARWQHPLEAAPETLRAHASELGERLGTANRLVAAGFAGSPADTVKVAAIGDAMKRLENAYLEFQRQTASVSDSADAAMLLEAEVCEVESKISGLTEEF